MKGREWILEGAYYFQNSSFCFVLACWITRVGHPSFPLQLWYAFLCWFISSWIWSRAIDLWLGWKWEDFWERVSLSWASFDAPKEKQPAVRLIPKAVHQQLYIKSLPFSPILFQLFLTFLPNVGAICVQYLGKITMLVDLKQTIRAAQEYVLLQHFFTNNPSNTDVWCYL